MIHMKNMQELKHPSEEELILYHYAEAGGPPRAVVAEHMALCEPCRARYRRLEAILAAADVVESPALGDDFEANVWRRLVPCLEAAPQGSLWQRFVGGRGFRQLWAPVAAAVAVAVLVVGAFLAGRFLPSRPQTQQEAQVQSPSVPSRERILLVAVGDHLERSQMVLVELVNSQPQPTVDISAQRQRAEELVPANRLYRLTAERSGETGMANVLDELERTLIEIAHSPSRLSSPEFENLRRRVEAQGILFKVRVISLQVQEKERKTIEGLSRKSL